MKEMTKEQLFNYLDTLEIFYNKNFITLNNYYEIKSKIIDKFLRK